MNLHSRRSFLRDLGHGTACCSLASAFGPSLLRGARPPRGLPQLAAELGAASWDDVFDVAAAAVRSGAGSAEILGATFLAGVQHVRPRHVGGKLHCVMVVESCFELSSFSSPRDAWLFALWNLDDLKRSQRADRREGDWELPPRPDASYRSADVAKKDFLEAMDQWDAPRADRALVGLLPHLDHDGMFELLWPLAARSFVNIGHKIIYAAQIDRVLGRIGWEHAEAPLRSLVNGLLNAESGDRQMAAFQRSRNFVAELPADWLQGKEDPAQSLAILRAVRDASSAQAQRIVIRAIQEGTGPATVWDGLRLVASELFLRRPQSRPVRRGATLLPVHAVTEIEALGHAFRRTRDDATRRLMVLQAAGWLPLLREGLAVRGALVEDGPRIDALGEASTRTPGSLDELMAAPRPDDAFRFLEEEGSADAYRGSLRHELARKGEEHHQHKYAAAMHIESLRVHPRWRAHLLAPAVPYLRTPGDPDPRVYDRSLHALRKAGVI